MFVQVSLKNNIQASLSFSFLQARQNEVKDKGKPIISIGERALDSTLLKYNKEFGERSLNNFYVWLHQLLVPYKALGLLVVKSLWL